MKSFKLALVALIAAGVAPTATFADELDTDTVEVADEYAALNEEGSDELKDLIGAMKTDRSVNRGRVKRIKQLIRDKGWHKNKDHSEDAEGEAEPEAT